MSQRSPNQQLPGVIILGKVSGAERVLLDAGSATPAETTTQSIANLAPVPPNTLPITGGTMTSFAGIAPQLFGAQANGISDDTIPILEAQALASTIEGGFVYYNGIFRITAPIFVLSNVGHVGVNGAIIINTTPLVPAYAYQTDCFYIGEFTINSIALFPAFNVLPPTSGDTVLYLVNPADVTNFAAGDLVILCSGDQILVNGEEIPTTNLIVKIIETADDGSITLEFPITVTLPSADLRIFVGENSFTGNEFQCVENVFIQDLTLQNGSISMGAMYNSTISNLIITSPLGPRNFISWNGLAHSTVSDITGTFANRAFEIKLGSSDSTITNVSCTYQPIAGITPNGIMSMGEFAFNITVNNLTIDATGALISDPNANALGMEYCNTIVIDGMSIAAPNALSGVPLLLFSGQDIDSAIYNCVLTNCTFTWEFARHYIAWGSGPYAPYNNTFNNIEFFGYTASQSNDVTGGSGNVWNDPILVNGTLTPGPHNTVNYPPPPPPGTVNMLINSMWGGYAQAATPLYWTIGLGSGAIQTTSLYGSDAYAETISAAAGGPTDGRSWITQTLSVAASTSYCFSFTVESNTSGLPVQGLMNFGASYPAGSTVSFHPSKTYVPVPGDRIYAVLAVGASSGTAEARVGIGVNTFPETGTVIASRPQFEIGTSPSAWQSTPSS